MALGNRRLEKNKLRGLSRVSDVTVLRFRALGFGFRAFHDLRVCGIGGLRVVGCQGFRNEGFGPA